MTVDGPGGSGKSTTVAALSEHLRQNGHTVHTTSEPSPSPLGAAIRKLANDVHGIAPALLVAADRHHHVTSEIRPALAAGHIVICDRYLPTSLVLQRLDGVPLDFIQTINAGIMLPDLAVILTAPAATISERLLARGSHHRFEDDPANVQRELDLYEQAIEILESIPIRIAHIDISGLTPAGVVQAILHTGAVASATVAPDLDPDAG